MIKKIIQLIFLFCLFVWMAAKDFNPVLAQESLTLIYDTSNHYLGTCGLTDKTTWTLEKDLEVKLFQIWYNWDAGETQVGFTLKKDGQAFLAGIATRSQCDPYQKSWCNGDLKVEKTFTEGTYELKVDKRKQCAIPNGNGTVRLYGLETASLTPQPTITIIPTIISAAATTVPTILPSQPPMIQKCSCQWCYPAAGFLVLSNLLTLVFLLRKK